MASSWIAEKMGDMVEDAVKKALGKEDKDKDKNEGGMFSKIFNRDNDNNDKKKKKKSEKDKDDKKDGFFSKIFDRDDGEDKQESKSGFSGLFSEGATSAGGHDGDNMGGGMTPQTVQLNDGDLFDDLMDVAEETSRGK